MPTTVHKKNLSTDATQQSVENKSGTQTIDFGWAQDQVPIEQSYIVRLDVPWSLGVLPDSSAWQRCEWVHQQLCAILAHYIPRDVRLVPYGACALHDQKSRCACSKISRIGWQHVRERVRSKYGLDLDGSDRWAVSQDTTGKGALVSLDPWIYGRWRLQTSRWFDPMDQTKAAGHVERPGCAPLDKQIRQLLEAQIHQVILVDDDCASGATMRRLTHVLECYGVKTIGVQTLIPSGSFDVVDARDFIPGSTHGGLLLRQADGRLERKTYAYPDVDLKCRAHIEDVKGFTQQVQRLHEQCMLDSWTARTRL